MQNTAFTRAIVFARTKHGADKIVKHLDRAGIRAAAIHGNKSQNVRQRTLADFKSNRPPVLVATDIAARGLDVNGISHVINYELPEVAEIYVHRIGRTGRAGATGIATTFCSRDERDLLRQIERLTRQTITIEQAEPEHPNTTPAAASRRRESMTAVAITIDAAVTVAMCPAAQAAANARVAEPVVAAVVAQQPHAAAVRQTVLQHLAATSGSSQPAGRPQRPKKSGFWLGFKFRACRSIDGERYNAASSKVRATLSVGSEAALFA